MPPRNRELAGGTNNTRNRAPFSSLNKQDVKVLVQSNGFKILRDHLEQTYSYELCVQHSKDQPNSKSHWLLVRDILHALLVPIVELYDRATTLAISTINGTNLDDHESAFSGSARGAFLWLRCFLSSEKERDWCYTRGCPACVMEHTLDSDFSVRLLYAACLLSDVRYPDALDDPKLPSFRFFLSSLQLALSADARYGPGFFDSIETKAVATRNGIEDLILQCVELESALTLSASPSDGTTHISSPAISDGRNSIGDPRNAKQSSEVSNADLERGRTPRRQTSIQMEQEHMAEMMKRCRVTKLPPGNKASDLASPRKMSDVAKKGPTVTVTSLQTAG